MLSHLPLKKSQTLSVTYIISSCNTEKYYVKAYLYVFMQHRAKHKKSFKNFQLHSQSKNLDILCTQTISGYIQFWEYYVSLKEAGKLSLRKRLLKSLD